MHVRYPCRGWRARARAVIPATTVAGCGEQEAPRWAALGGGGRRRRKGDEHRPRLLGRDLVTAGVVALAVQPGHRRRRPPARRGASGRSCMIVIGIAVIAARTPFAMLATVVAALVVGGLAGTLVADFPNGLHFGCERRARRPDHREGSFTPSAEVDLDMNCGELNVTTAGDGDWSVEARIIRRRAAIGVRCRQPPRRGGRRRRSSGSGMPTRRGTSRPPPTDPTLDARGQRQRRFGPSTWTMRPSTLAINANAGRSTSRCWAHRSTSCRSGERGLGRDQGGRRDGAERIGRDERRIARAVRARRGSVAITMSDDNVTFSHDLDELGLTREGDVWRTGTATSSPSRSRATRRASAKPRRRVLMNRGCTDRAATPSSAASPPGSPTYLNADPALVRIVWAILVVVTGGAALIVYIVAWIVVPEEPPPPLRRAGDRPGDRRGRAPTPAPPPAFAPGDPSVRRPGGRWWSASASC